MDDAVGYRELFPDHGRLYRSRDSPPIDVSPVIFGAAAGCDFRGQYRRTLAAPRRPAIACHRHRLFRDAGGGAGAEFLRPAAGPADADQRNAMAVGGLGLARRGAAGSAGPAAGIAPVCRPVLGAAGLERRATRAVAWWRFGGRGGACGAREALSTRLDSLSLLGIRADHCVAVRVVEPDLGLGRHSDCGQRAIGRTEVQVDCHRRRRHPPSRLDGRAARPVDQA